MKRLLILLLLLPLAGCVSAAIRAVADAVESPTYSQDYGVYVVSMRDCLTAPQSHLTLEGGGQYPLPRDCNQLRPPESSAPARATAVSGVLNLGGDIVQVSANSITEWARAHENRKGRESDNTVLIEAFRRAGPSIGRDGFVGNGSTGFTITELVEEEEPVDGEEPEEPEVPEEPVDP